MKCTQERTNKYSNYTQQNNNKLLDVERSEDKIPLKVLQTILLSKVKVSSETVFFPFNNIHIYSTLLSTVKKLYKSK